MADVVVVGAGAGGLAAAIDLASAGLEVTVLEARSEAGGKIGRQVVDGVEFDTGPSVLTMPEVARSLLEDAGTSSDVLRLVQHDLSFDYRWPDGTSFPVHFDIERTISSAAETFGKGAAKELRKFHEYAKRIWDEAAPAFVFGAAPSFGSMLSLGVRALGALRKVDPLRTMSEGIAAHVKEPHLRDVLWRYATYNGSDPRTAPATLNCIAHVELGRGAYGVADGMYELVRTLEGVARELGVEFVFGAPVERLETHRGRVVAVHTPDGTHSVDTVVANADVHHVFTDLLDPRPGYDPAEPSMSGWTAVARIPRAKRAPHTVLFPADYAPEFEAIFDRRELPAEPTVYLCAQEPAHRRTGWEHAEPVFMMANAPADAGPQDFDAFEEKIVARMRAFDLWPDDAEIVWRRTPLQLADHFRGSRGALYGAASNSRFAAFQRPANRSEIGGLYLASGSAHPGGGVPLCLLSGRAAARALLSERK